MTLRNLTSCNDFPTEQTLHQNLALVTNFDLYRITKGCHGNFLRVWHTSRDRLPLRSRGSVPFMGVAHAHFFETGRGFPDFSIRISLGTVSIFASNMKWWSIVATSINYDMDLSPKDEDRRTYSQHLNHVILIWRNVNISHFKTFSTLTVPSKNQIWSQHFLSGVHPKEFSRSMDFFS